MSSFFFMFLVFGFVCFVFPVCCFGIVFVVLLAFFMCEFAVRCDVVLVVVVFLFVICAWCVVFCALLRFVVGCCW